MTLSYSLAKKRPSSLSIGLPPIFFLQSGKPMGAEPLTRGICFSLLYQPAWRKVTFTHGEQIWVDHRSSLYESLREPVLCYNLLFPNSIDITVYGLFQRFQKIGFQDARGFLYGVFGDSHWTNKACSCIVRFTVPGRCPGLICLALSARKDLTE